MVLRETTFQVSGIPWLEIDINLVIVMKTVMLGILMVLMAFGCQNPKNREGAARDTMSKQRITLETATFAGGCFWCMESDFEKVDGVFQVISGYTGGHKENPTYEDVSSGVTGHVEAVQVRYDPSRVTYKALLDYLARVPGWGTGWMRFHFHEGMQKLATIEPLANRFIQDQLRGSPLFFYAQVLDGLLRDANHLIRLPHELFGRDVGAGNCGYASTRSNDKQLQNNPYSRRQ